MATETENTTYLLNERPTDKLTVGHFTRTVEKYPSAGTGEVIVRTVLLSISPGSRAWMQQATYRGQLESGEPMSGYVIGEVVDGNGTGLTPGTIVSGLGSWQEYSALPAAEVQPVQVRGPLTHHMSTLGTTGLTGYFGMLAIGQPKPGDTVLVSAAAGATGNVAGQIARIKGARVIGVTSSPQKNAMLEAELGFQATLNHRDPDFAEQLAGLCPDGIDVYFDNVGGHVLEAALDNMNVHGRIVCCGSVSQYDEGTGRAPGPANVPTVLVTKRLLMQGFIVFDYADRFPAALEELAGWIEAGQLRVLEDVRDGLDSAPEALIDLLSGGNTGKLIIRVGPDRLDR